MITKLKQRTIIKILAFSKAWEHHNAVDGHRVHLSRPVYKTAQSLYIKNNNNNNSNGVHTSRSWIYDHQYIASVQESDAYLESVTKGPLTTEKLRRYPQKTWYGPHNFLAAYTNNNGWRIRQKVGSSLQDTPCNNNASWRRIKKLIRTPVLFRLWGHRRPFLKPQKTRVRSHLKKTKYA